MAIRFNHALFYRAGMTYACVLCIVLFSVVCSVLEFTMAPDVRLWHPPIFNGMLICLLVSCTYIFIAQHAYRKSSYWKNYPWIFLTTMIFYVFLSTFCYLKSIIPFIQPYYLDPMLQRIDIWLHFGYVPSQVLLPLFTPKTLHWLDIYYGEAWFIGLDLYMFWQLFTARQLVGRIQFLSTFLMMFILLGNGLATICSSVGPMFYGLFYHDGYTAMNDAFLQKLTASNAVYPLEDVLGARDLLLGWYHEGRREHKNIMSSMPSMHLAVCILMIIHSYNYAKPLLWLTIPFTAIMFVGSVVLGWHYAVDTYVSAIGVYLIWKLNGLELKRFHRHPALLP